MRVVTFDADQGLGGVTLVSTGSPETINAGSTTMMTETPSTATAYYRAMSKPGYKFSQWVGNQQPDPLGDPDRYCEGGTETVDASLCALGPYQSLTAVFEPLDESTIDLDCGLFDAEHSQGTVECSGYISVGSGAAKYYGPDSCSPSVTSVQLTAVANPQYAFRGWDAIGAFTPAGDPIQGSTEATIEVDFSWGERPLVTAIFEYTPIELLQGSRHIQTSDDPDTTGPFELEDVAWIYPHGTENATIGDPAMPALSAQLTDSCDPEVTVEWRLTVNYHRQNRNDTVVFPPSGYTAPISVSDPWIIPWTDSANNVFFCGGNATLDADFEPFDGTPDQTFNFRILGQNPDDAAVVTFIQSLSPSPPDYFRYMCKQESQQTLPPNQTVYFCQFNEKTDVTGDPRVLWTPNGHEDNNTAHTVGYGICQVTDPVPTIPELWNWEANIVKGWAIMRGKIADADDWMNEQRGQALADEGENMLICDRREGDLSTNGLHNDETGCYLAPSGKVLFSDVVALAWTFEGAVAMKMFNGSRHNYCYWQPRVETVPGIWRFNPQNEESTPFNHVNRVCNEVEGTIPPS